MSNNNKKLVFKGGFTLVELIITIGIMGIVLTMAYCMGDYGNKSFNNGSAKSDIQSNTRLAANYITKELRYSSNAEILTALPTTLDSTKKYIYVDNEILKQYYNGHITNIVGDNANNIKTTLQFQIQDSGTVDFSIQENLKNQNFKLNSTILLLNIGNNILANNTGPVISYTNEPSISNITTTTPYNDLVNVFEKNVINIIGDSTTPFDMNTVLNASNDSRHGILIQAQSVSGFKSGTNINCKLAIGASTISGVSSNAGDVVLDVSTINSLGTINGSAYFPSNLISNYSANNYNNNNYKVITTYPQDGFWISLFANTGDSHIKTFALRTLKPNINFASTSINPNQSLNSKIHYFDGNHPQVVNKTTYNNVIYLNKLPDSTGSFSAGSTTNSNNYEYIICHGDLNIIGDKNTYQNFNFKGLIYCDGNVNVSSVSSAFVLNGIIISKGITNNNVGKWDSITFDNNSGNLSDINTILNNTTQ
ncbi:PilW family protein [Clostridium psychrophilum]|uniref:PilW family protein n=1 Tax=Clostridium psychrophilum TaxID=132926 RepID=UPI001C0C52F5|nr:prepilin-type N-terminal cleavage/methylation domain-containing protein [Clostridium psychrophilum]MBU3182040.1 prepilin-type N-terminal cleavage/methylation domain-containing protein [Clostridium psychrophilum]